MSAEQQEKLSSERYPFIAVVGAPGSGKSSLIEALVEQTKIRIIEEPYQENPYLDGFYTDDPKKYAFDSQMFFLPNRGLEMGRVRPLLVNQSVMQDSTLDADGVMAKALWGMWYISDKDYMAYMKVKREIEKDLLKPDILVYAKVSDGEATKRVIKRGRPMELKMLEKNPNYFEKLVSAFDVWYEKQKANSKGLVLFDTSKFDLTNGPDAKAFVVRECCNWLAYYLTAVHDKGLGGIGSDGAKLIMPDFLRPDNRFRDFLPGEIRDR